MTSLAPPAPPCVLVIFGAAGDLSWRKLLPALYNLNVDGLLPSNFAVVGFGIGAEGDPDEWIRARARDGIRIEMSRAMIPITTSSSTSVKPLRLRDMGETPIRV